MQTMRVSYLLILKAFLLLVSACTEKVEPWTSQQRCGKSAVIYNEDSRQESSKINEARFLSAKAASGALVLQERLKIYSSEEVRIDARTLIEHLNYCPEQRFASQKAAAICSGTLITDHLLLTAGHCLPTDFSCSELSVIFGYDNKVERKGEQVVSQKNVYRCAQVEFLSLPDAYLKPDFAVIRLDRKVEDIQPVKIGPTARLSHGDRLYSFSYPSGLPQKFHMGILRDHEETPYFRAKIDFFHGSSGAMVYNYSDLSPIGIVLGGEEDYTLDSKRLCFKPKICSEAECRGEKILRLDKILETISSNQALKTEIESYQNKLKTESEIPSRNQIMGDKDPCL